MGKKQKRKPESPSSEVVKEKKQKMSKLDDDSTSDASSAAVLFFKENFFGHPLPKLLQDYYTWSQTTTHVKDKYWVSGFEWVSGHGLDTLHAWMGRDEEDDLAKQFLVFAMADGTGSMYALWMYPTMGKFKEITDVENAPVVYLGSEGLATVVADNLKELVALQAAELNGDDICCWNGEVEPFTPSRELDGEEETDDERRIRLSFSEWVHKEQGIKPIDDVWKVVKEAARKHPDVEKVLIPED